MQETQVNSLSSDFERLKLNDQLFHHLTEEIKDFAIFMMKFDGTIGTWNPGVKRLLGYEEEEFIDHPFSLIFMEEDKEIGVPDSELKTALLNGKAEDERWHQRKDGSRFWASGLVTVVKDDHGKPQGFVKIMRDQTQKKEFEEKLAEQANALASANKELSHFAGVVSHDLNAPLQTLYGFAKILEEKKGLDAEAEESLHYIADGAKRMMALVKDLLQSSTVASQSTDLSLVNSEEVLKQVLLGLTNTIQSREATISYKTLPSIWASETQLSRIFQNLIENSIKYTPSDRVPHIEISATSDDQKVIFAVRDNGIGIREEDRDRIFKRFERLHPEKGVAGKGIGLTTCKNIVEQLDGSMWFTSNLDEGTTFFFSLPHPAEVASSDNDKFSFDRTDSSPELHPPR